MEDESDGELATCKYSCLLECVMGEDGGRKFIKNAGTYTASQPEESNI
jgi:hypothetical protein